MIVSNEGDIYPFIILFCISLVKDRNQGNQENRHHVLISECKGRKKINRK